MKPSPAFTITLCAVVVLGALTLHTLQGDAARHDAAATHAAEGLGGHATAQEEADKRTRAFAASLDAMQQEAAASVEALKHKHELARLRRDLEDAKAANAAAQAARERMRQGR